MVLTPGFSAFLWADRRGTECRMPDTNRRKSKAAESADRRDEDDAGTLETIKDQASDMLSRAATATRDVSRRAAGAMGDAYQATVNTGAAWEEQAVKFIRRNPMTTVLATAGVSLLIGFALGRE